MVVHRSLTFRGESLYGQPSLYSFANSSQSCPINVPIGVDGMVTVEKSNTIYWNSLMSTHITECDISAHEQPDYPLCFARIPDGCQVSVFLRKF